MSESTKRFRTSQTMQIPQAPDLTAREFERRLRELERGFAPETANVSCVACERCTGSSACTFCKDSERLVRCHFCVRCSDCTEALPCRGSKGLLGCSPCVDCEGCSHSAYLVRSASLASCNYCFCCVGLSNRDSHVSNEPYDRKTYFQLTERLSRELGL